MYFIAKNVNYIIIQYYRLFTNLNIYNIIYFFILNEFYYIADITENKIIYI